MALALEQAMISRTVMGVYMVSRESGTVKVKGDIQRSLT